MLPVLEDDLVMRNCKCIGMVRKERKRCKEMVMAMADRLGLEERIHAHVSEDCLFCINFILPIPDQEKR